MAPVTVETLRTLCAECASACPTAAITVKDAVVTNMAECYKEPEQRRLSQSCLTDDQCNGPLLLKQFESCQGLIDAWISLQPLNRDFFGKGMGSQTKVIKKNYDR